MDSNEKRKRLIFQHMDWRGATPTGSSSKSSARKTNDHTTNNNSSNRVKSNGISPKSFHSRRTFEKWTKSAQVMSPKSSVDALSTVLQEASDRVKVRANKEYTNQLKFKRSAFRSVTNVQIFSRQEQALQALDRMLRLHLNVDDDEKRDHRNAVESNQEKNEGFHIPAISLRNISNDNHDHRDANNDGQFNLYVSSSSGGASLGEGSKRNKPTTKKRQSISPRKASERSKHVEVFLADRKIPYGVSTDAQFLPPLWSMEPRILSVETSKTGRRRYVVGNFGRLADYYWRKLDPSARHYYELIRERTPCRLYFDIEYCRESNPGITSKIDEEIMDELIKELSCELTVKHNLSIERKNIVDLDSSTTKKFSRHLIVHLPNGSLFSDTSHVGSFVKAFVSRLADEKAIGELQKKRPILSQYLFVNAKPAKNSVETTATSCIIDLGVYTRNRLFRILGSSKFGKPSSAALRLSDTNQFPFPDSFSNNKFYIPAQQNRYLTSGHNDNNDVSDHESKVPSLEHIMTVTDWHSHAEALARTFVVPLNLSKVKFPILDKHVCDEGDSIRNSTIGKKTIFNSVPQSSNNYGSSPFICLDDFVQSTLAGRGGEQGVIRAWAMSCYPCAGSEVENNNKTFDIITYHMSRNRWCERIQRSHKSNNIMWNVDFRSFQYWQTCHDPDCRAMHFKGKRHDLPADVKTSLDDILFEKALIQMPEYVFNDRKLVETKNVDTSFENALVKLVDDIENSRLIGNTQEEPNNNTVINHFPHISTNSKENSALNDSWDETFQRALESNPELFP